jgi:hypothetical protein
MMKERSLKPKRQQQRRSVISLALLLVASFGVALFLYRRRENAAALAIENSIEIYDTAVDAQLYAPVHLHIDPMEGLLPVNFENDPDEIYIGFEPQLFDDPIHGRGLRYLTVGGGYELADLPAVMLWTAVFAVMIALNYVFLKSAFREASPMRSALRFTFILFGIHYALFVYFVPLIFSGLLIDLTIVLASDLLLALLASFITTQVAERVATPMTLERMAVKK